MHTARSLMDPIPTVRYSEADDLDVATVACLRGPCGLPKLLRTFKCISASPRRRS
ncbi:Protein of unknown function [Pyronema omphalodes CBS 100304]|uniref:Uncharacterized protein n=1 Tax=Pyronema omphalodes (strain CBS 100304) TaxID=1076935 RepID=U4KVR9_PYROM|nr:Protein of unknown function [Pyronema omphalodes CBS 100304]